GLFSGPWYLDVAGGFAAPLAAELIRGADVIVAWGCTLSMWTTRHGRLIAPGARVAQVDVEPAALGANRRIDLGVVGDVAATALAQPERLPVAALGDGGYLMGISELDTVVRLGLPMMIVVYDDAGFGAEVHHFGPDGYPLDTVTYPDTDLAAIGRGYGCAGVTVREPADLDAVREWLAGPRERPLVVD